MVAASDALTADALTAYDRLTDGRSRFVRVDALCARGAEEFPDLLPSAKDLEPEAGRAQGDKKGLERAQGEFLASILADPVSGAHLCHAMLLPHPRTAMLRAEFEKKGQVSLPGARLERQGKAAVLTMSNPRFLNAEDETTLEGMEIAVDLALLDPQTEVCVLRGGAVGHPKYAVRPRFGAGIQLTHLYHGKIRYLWYLIRDLGFVNQGYPGLAVEGQSPEETSTEKLWIAALEGFAIGGHWHGLLTIDPTNPPAGAYPPPPPPKEGVI